MILLSAHQIEKSYNHQRLFTNVSLGIEERERIGFVGPNGAGKSTLLKILAGELDADGGTISRSKGLRIGFLAQTPHFPKGATIFEQILSKCQDKDESLPFAYELMSRLELSTFGDDYPVDQLSGGWQKKVALARELVTEPQLLLLDEPTNHLDLSSVLWLEEYLRSAEFAILMVTHDRLFLQRVANRIIDLDPRNPNYLLSVNGDYSQYLETKELELAALKRHEQVEKNRLRRETDWLRRGSIARQAKQSARINAAGDLKDTVQDLKDKNQHRIVNMNFGELERSPKKLIEATGITKSYGDKILFENLDLLITPKTRLGLLGDNGSGKSTLIKVLLGMEAPDSGKIKMTEGIEVAYFEQSRETLQLDLSILKNICPEGDYVFFQGHSLHVRSYLDRFYFSGHKIDLPVRKLSGGEMARLRLAQLMLKKSQILVLDEPTNDLDIDVLDSLENSLKEYNGAVILVTHDRYFLDAVANQILAFPPPEFGQQSLPKFSSYFQWENWYNEERAGLSGKKKTNSTSTSTEAASAPKKKLTFKETFELEKMESTILELENELKALKIESETSTVLSDHKRLTEILSQLATLQATIDQKYERWTELESRK